MPELESVDMFVHIVFWRLLDNAPNGRSKEDNARELKRRFEALRGSMPGLRRCDLGIDLLHTTESSDVALYAEFESRAAYEAYATHDAHKEIVGFLKELRSERRVVDYEV
jgi:heme-degrading monooxygenase HmoA